MQLRYQPHVAFSGQNATGACVTAPCHIKCPGEKRFFSKEGLSSIMSNRQHDIRVTAAVAGTEPGRGRTKPCLDESIFFPQLWHVSVPWLKRL
ncbi:hypothetical protein BJX64DRAFT_271110 [Aspergillus heterothallicus]